MSRPQLSIENLSKSYGNGKLELKVIEDLSLSIKAGRFISIIGPNGSGKTTLLKIIAGIEKPSAGQVKTPGSIAYLPQEGSLMPWLSVRDNLRLPAKIKGATSSKLEKKIDRYLAQFGLSEFDNFYPAALSGGMRQKVALIRTAIYKPDLIILDEPFSALDAITRLQMQTWLVKLWLELKCSVVCVTHDISEAIFLGDEIYVLSSRPAKIIRRLAIDAKRPREIDDLNGKKMLSIQKKLRELLVNEN